MEFKTRIKELRIEKNISQAKLAKLLNFSQSAIAKWELGKSEPNSNTLKLLANFFEVSTDYLLGKDDIEKPITHIIPVVARSKGNTEPKRMIEITDEEYKTLLKIIEQANKNRK